MGKRGPKPQPTTLKVLHGNPGKRPLNDAEPQPRACLPPCPGHLTGLARAQWNILGEMLYRNRVMTEQDAICLELLCLSYVEHVEAAEKVAKGGPVWIRQAESAKELPKFVYSPYWAVQGRAFKKLLALLREFGMTPSSRSAIKTVGGEKEDGESFEDFLKEHG